MQNLSKILKIKINHIYNIRLIRSSYFMHMYLHLVDFILSEKYCKENLNLKL